EEVNGYEGSGGWENSYTKFVQKRNRSPSNEAYRNTGALRKLEALQKRPMVPESCVARLVRDLLGRAKHLMDSSVSFPSYPASRKLLAAFLAWLEASGRVSEMAICLAAWKKAKELWQE
ncbi:21563_t:CDS:2, partial [Dentiscutata erythropus]